MDDLPEWELRPVKNERGTFDALDANGWGTTLGWTEREVECWIDGYNTGARENM